MGVLRHRAWWAAWAVLAAPAALAQSTNACDQLKATLAARIEATGVRGYSLEAMPAAAPLPKDGRVIGNCEGGAFKMVYRRFGGSAPGADPVPGDKPPAERPEAAKPVTEKPAAEKPVLPKSVADKAMIDKPVTDKPVVEKPAPSPSPAAVVAPPVPSPVAVSPSPSPPPPAPVADSVPPQPPAEATPASDAGGGSFLPVWWPWLSLGLALPLLMWGWSRVSYRLHYDEAGLPRGPRLS